MTDRRFDPARRCLPPGEWPAVDQAAWEQALRIGNVLDGTGPGAKWAPATRKARAKAYGRWLNYLKRKGALNPFRPPANRVQPVLIAAYVAMLRRQVTSASVWSMLDHLHAAFRAMAPERDWTWLRRVVNRLQQTAQPARSIVGRLRPTHQIYHAGIQLMRQAERDTGLPPLLRASRFRDGLMLAFQAARPLRLKNLSSLAFGRHLARTSERYVFHFEAAEMKNRRPLEFPLPDGLACWFDRYLERHRPILLQGHSSDAVWITKQGRPMRPFSVHARITKVTKRLFGKPMSTHLFRHALATSIAIEDPEHVRMATALLGHRQLNTTDRYYNMAQALQSSRAHASLIANLRRELKSVQSDRTIRNQRSR